MQRQALELLPASQPDRSMSLENFLQTRFEQFGQFEDLEEAILLYRRALELHLYRPVSLDNLTNALSVGST